DDLYEFADLRNAIVHSRVKPNYVIAEPHDATVYKINKIEEEISKPKMVIPEFQCIVRTFGISESLSVILKTIHEMNFSQFPIYDRDKFMGLVTSNGITNWLSQNIKEDLVSIQDTKMSDVLHCEESQENYKFISKDTTIYEADDFFKANLSKGIPLKALLITHNGRHTEKL